MANVSLSLGQQLGQAAAPTIAAIKAPVFGMPWEVWLIVLAVIIPFLFVIGVSVALYFWARGKMQLDRFIKIYSSGQVEIGDMKPEAAALNMKEEKHLLRKGKPKHFLLSRFGWRQPLHFFQQGTSLELEIDNAKIHSGKDNENSEFLKAYVDTERAKQIFNISLNLGFSLVLAIAAGAIGILVGLAIAHFSNPATGATAANVTTTTILQGAIKK
jgi:hypothetical protein